MKLSKSLYAVASIFILMQLSTLSTASAGPISEVSAAIGFNKTLKQLKLKLPEHYKASKLSEYNSYGVKWPSRFAPQKTRIFAQNSIFIEGASPKEIFNLLIDANTWPNWYGNSQDVNLGGAAKLRPGLNFTWYTFKAKQNTKIKEFKNHGSKRVLAWLAISGTPAALSRIYAYHRWILIKKRGGTLVVTQETQYGTGTVLAKKLGMNEGLHAGHQLWLINLKRIYQGRGPIPLW